MKKTATRIAFLAVLAAPLLTIAQPMEKLSFMVGEWQGTGWSMTRAGKESSIIKEKVECKLDCHILAVNGQGTRLDPSTQESVIVHDAFGVITFDNETGKYMIRAHKKDNVVDAELIFLADRLFQWSIPAPGGMVRFTVDFTQPGTWKETGEYSSDGITWMKSMEMELKKIEN